MRRFVLPPLACCVLSTLALAQTPAPQQPITTTTINTSVSNTGSTLDVTAGSSDGKNVTANVHATQANLDGLDTYTSNGSATPTRPTASINSITFVSHTPYRPAQVGNIIFIENDKTILTNEFPALAIENTSFKAAAQKLAAAAKTNIVLGIRGLEQAHIDVSAPLTFKLPAGTFKEQLVAFATTAAKDAPLVITAGDNVIQIATLAQADNNIVTKWYYLEDLLGNLRIPTSPNANAHAASAKSTPPTTPTTPTTLPAATQSALDELTKLITSSVRPEIWKVNGGKIGEITIIGDKVSIRAPESVHALLDGPKHYNPNAVPRYIDYAQ